MPVHGDHLYDVAGGMLLLEELPHLAVASVPGGFVVDDDVDVPTIGGGADGAGMFHAHRERLFHHHVDVTFRAGLDHHTMVVRAGKPGDGFGLDPVDHA